jgi:alpha-tubulin suppressor-like RCC1 family protein
MPHIGGLTVRRWLTAVTLVGSMLAVAGPAQAAAKATLHVSVAVTPATAKVGSVAVVSGTVSSHKAAIPLVLQRLVSKHWTTIAHAKTTAGGRYAIKLRAPKKAATWVLRVTRTAAKPTNSAAVHLRAVKNSFAVRASAPHSVASGVPLVVTGSVAPKASGSVWLQRLQGSTWHNLVTVKLTKTSTFRLSKVLPSGAYRLRMFKAFSTTVAEGHSTTLAVTVAAPAPPPAALAVATTALPTGTMGRPYTTTLAASGGRAPYTWGLQGSLPAGLSLSAAGVLAGFPSATSSAAVTVVVADTTGASASRTLVLTVGASPAAGRTIRAWGYNASGELGNGSTTDSNTPVQVGLLTGVVAVAASGGAAYGLRDDGTVWAWGANTFRQLGDGTTTDSSVPVQVIGVSGITALASTNASGIARRYDGTVWTWGAGAQGQLGNGTTAATSSVVQVTGLTGAVAVAGGWATGYALRSDGTVWAWGEGGGGELGDGKGTSTSTPVQVSSLSGITAIAAGGDAGYALRSDGTVWAWGHNDQGQLGDNSTTPRLSPVQVSGLSGVKAIAGNLWNGYALLTNGTVSAWGKNDLGQLGDGSTSGRSIVPVQVQGLTGVAAISAGVDDGYALHPDGTVSAWGSNVQGQLGNGSAVANSNVPVLVSGLSGVVSLGCGVLTYAAYAVV